MTTFQATFRKDFAGSFSEQVRSYVRDGLWACWSATNDHDLFVFADLDVDEENKTLSIRRAYRFGFGFLLDAYTESYNYVDPEELTVLSTMAKDKGYTLLEWPIVDPCDLQPPTEEELERWEPFSEDIFRAPPDTLRNICMGYGKAMDLFKCDQAP